VFGRAGDILVFVKFGAYGGARFAEGTIVAREQVAARAEEAAVAGYGSEGCGG